MLVRADLQAGDVVLRDGLRAVGVGERWRSVAAGVVCFGVGETLRTESRGAGGEVGAVNAWLAGPVWTRVGEDDASTTHCNRAAENQRRKQSLSHHAFPPELCACFANAYADRTD